MFVLKFDKNSRKKQASKFTSYCLHFITVLSTPACPIDYVDSSTLSAEVTGDSAAPAHHVTFSANQVALSCDNEHYPHSCLDSGSRLTESTGVQTGPVH